MRRYQDQTLYSASDLMHFLSCTHAAALNILNLDTPLQKTADTDQQEMFQRRGLEHEKNYLEELRKSGRTVTEISVKGKDLQAATAETIAAMKSGVDVIYQATLFRAPWHGFADFLVKVPKPSSLGDYSYEAVDTKLARTAQPKHILQLCIYSDLLESIQGVRPDYMSVKLGEGTMYRLRFDDVAHYYHHAKLRFEHFIADQPRATSPEPCSYCDMCVWRDNCNAEWLRTDHLCQVANIKRDQIHKLNDAGFMTLEQLAKAPTDLKVRKMGAETASRLRAQAELQFKKRQDAANHLEILPLRSSRGFERLPQPNVGDLFFDMEGDPLYDGGLEYLFGVIDRVNGAERFTAFWAHDHAEEKLAFEQLMDFFTAHLKNYPEAHIYHYNHYEPTALKRLAANYGTREDAVDDLLRQHRLVDLFQVVREAIRISEPRYSIKNLETFYMEKRDGEVKTAGDSIVMYERWRETGEQKLLDDIADYNRIDCVSTAKCLDWLLTLRPEALKWFTPEINVDEPEKTEAQQIAEEEQKEVIERLQRGANDNNRSQRELVGHLLQFHRREAKPAWWAMFDRQNRETEELIDDIDCLGNLQLAWSPEPEKRSLIWTYKYPVQETKFTEGKDCLRAETLEGLGKIYSIDRDKKLIQLKRGASREPLPDTLSLIPGGPINTAEIKAALKRFINSVADEEDTYRACSAIIARALPSINGMAEGSPLRQDGQSSLDAALAIVPEMDYSYLFIQGPPGAGKSHTSAHVIVELLRRGKRVGIASNSHKAVNNLMQKVSKVAQEQSVEFLGAKKATKDDEDTWAKSPMIDDVFDHKSISSDHKLVGGTAWLFSREEHDQAFDYLFIDEAGQVALANVVAMGTCAQNVVLVGDQMQLGQPVQGVHPGESGQSVLDYLLQGEPTVRPEQGLFLGESWRMHPDVCQFISDVIYGGELRSHPDCSNQRLILTGLAPEGIKPTGLSFVPMSHVGCSQSSEQEAEYIKQTYSYLLNQTYTDKKGVSHSLSPQDILVISPYNLQVNHLKQVLPDGALVGTVDKFQGQEAPVVLISMATSSGEEMPRDIEFLYSRNRLNVAISRAKCLAVLVANPKLLEISCSTVDQMKLVNTLCWAKTYSIGSE